MANWLVRGIKKLAGVGQAIIDSPLDDIALGLVAPSLSPQWTRIQATIHKVQVKYADQEGMGAVKKAEVLALSPEALELANEAIAWTGKKMEYDMAAVSEAIDMSVALEKKIKDILSSAKLVSIEDPPVPA